MILLVMTDGRVDCLSRAIESARENLCGEVTHKVIHDDTGDESYREELRATFPDFDVIGQPTRQGFGGAIRSAWAALSGRPERFVFHLEDDFTFNEPIDLPAMQHVLDRNPGLVQLALRRQPWNPDELAAGGIVEQHPDDYVDCSDGISDWLEHRRFFTTNPSMYRRALTEKEWPEGEHSEGRFGIALCENPTTRFGYWGRRDDPPKVHHIGEHRAGVGY
ncbi:MAG: glycosyltransferase [Ilumatobacteraceae bacterium]|nr:glycosyltransferase [Ilumatobacteraceae bacterium]